MPDLLEQGATWLTDQRQDHLARTVTYHRGADSVPLQATVGQTVFHTEDALGGGSIRVVSRDYLVRTVDLVLGGQPILPQRGDVIREVAGTVTFVHEVVAPGGTSGGASGGEWRYSDPQRTTIRIHTQEVDQEVV